MMQNMMRAKPEAFLPYVTTRKARFTRKIYTTNTGMRMGTNEGVSAVAEFESFLKSAKPVQ